MKGIKGYKVFRSDWTCSPDGNTKQYACPGKFEEEGELDICGHGMHFCQRAVDCFNYYNFDSRNKVAEVIAYGEVKTSGDKSCTDKLEIVREIPWEEVLRFVNIGENCTGYLNTGDYNTGDWNTGDYNTGDWNTGIYNTGDRNTGIYNTGDRNTGDWNTGDWNTGIYNTGDRNTGNWNTGNWNTGNWNTGNWNTGDWNKSSFNTGCFNTEEQRVMLFNKPSNMSYREWFISDARSLLNLMPKVVKWVYEEDMADKEKTAYPTSKTTGGYLRMCDPYEKRQKWWDELSNRDKQKIRDIPNFDADIFYECTGIRV